MVSPDDTLELLAEAVLRAYERTDQLGDHLRAVVGDDRDQYPDRHRPALRRNLGCEANWNIRTQARPLQGEPRPGLPPRGKPSQGHSGPPEVSQAQQSRLVIEARDRSSYLLEGPLCQQATVVEVEDHVCAPDGRQPVRDGDRGYS